MQESIPWTASALLQALSDLERTSPAVGTTWHLGQPGRSQQPPNWQRGSGAQALQPIDNLFNGMVAPNQVEIIDRWRAADGSHNVVVNLPNGRTVCGRAEASNPMQPLLEPVMMFRECGGGSQRSFSMPQTLSASQREQLSSGME